LSSLFLGLKKLNKSIKTTPGFVSLLFQAKRAYNEIVKVKRLIPLIAVVVILAGLPALVVPDTGASPTDSNIPDNEITTSQTEANNSSASATITITMYAVADE
jgi:hypothetical protein